MTKQHCPECERLGWVARALLAERQLAEAQAHVRNHHLEPCVSCAATESERDILKASLEQAKKFLDMAGYADALAAMCEHEDNAPHEGCECRVCSLVRQVERLKSNPAWGEVYGLREVVERLEIEHDDLCTRNTRNWMPRSSA